MRRGSPIRFAAALGEARPVRLPRIHELEEEAMPLQAGLPAPDFSLPDEDEKPHRLADYRGQPVVLYFYPRDDTPG